MKLAVLIPTYQRSDDKTPFYLKRAIDSVMEQHHQDFKIFVIGDKYENNDEFLSIVKQYDKEKMFYVNLPFAKERDAYSDNKLALWNYGGVNANNVGIELILSQGYKYICHLDHDDYWNKRHLFAINECIEQTNADFVCTKSTYKDVGALPQIYTDKRFLNISPRPETLIHSSTCINFETLNFRYRDLFTEKGVIGLPSDADMWLRIGAFVDIVPSVSAYMVNEITCVHDEEGFERLK
jgi:glycosyltransferase involved in cell wall biosynthesis